MFDKLQENLNSAIEQISKPASSTDSYAHFLCGDWGVGKSFLADKIRQKCLENHIVDAVFHIRDVRKLPFLYDFTLKLFESVNAELYLDGKLPAGETLSSTIRFGELIKELRERNTSLFEKVYNREHLLSQSEYLLFKDTFDKSSLDAFTEDIDNLIKKNSDKRLLKQSYSIASESFIVDLMSLFQNVPSTNGKPVAKRKILIIIDNYDPVAGGVSRWLAKSFFKYCYNASFKSFCAYEISLENPEAKVSDLFDFRFILTGRKNYLNYALNTPETFNPGLTATNLCSYKETNLEDYFKPLVESESRTFDELMAITCGIPAIAVLLKEVYQIGALLDDDISIIYQRAAESILRFYSEEQRDWIQIASFTESFSAKDLKCFSVIGEKYKYAYDFLKLSDELTEPVDGSTERIKVKHNVRIFIKRATTLLTEKTASEYGQIAEFSKISKDYLDAIEDCDFELIRNLAYFNRFDLNFAIDKAFQKDSDTVRNLISKYSDLFDISPHTYSLKESIRAIIDKFNFYSDMSKYEEKKELVANIQEMYFFEQNGKVAEIDTELKQLVSEKSKLLTEIEENTKKLEAAKAKQKITDDNLNISKLEKLHLEHNSSFMPAGSLFSAFVLFALIAYFTSGYSWASQSAGIFSFQTVIIVISALLLFVGAGYGVRAASSRARRRDSGLLYTKVAKLESDSRNLAEQISGLESETLSANKLVTEISGIIAELQHEKSNAEARLNEPFVKN